MLWAFSWDQACHKRLTAIELLDVNNDVTLLRSMHSFEYAIKLLGMQHVYMQLKYRIRIIVKVKLAYSVSVGY